jgi:hypothetical protein
MLQMGTRFSKVQILRNNHPTGERPGRLSVIAWSTATKQSSLRLWIASLALAMTA